MHIMMDDESSHESGQPDMVNDVVLEMLLIEDGQWA